MREIYRETHKGPFGIIRRRVPEGRVEDGKIIELKIGNSNVVICPNGQLMEIVVKGDPVRVVFEAEPERRRPKVIAELNSSRPDTRTTRGEVIVQPLEGGPEKLILRGPKFKPLLLTHEEVHFLKMAVRTSRFF